jgi:hypothetical protein
VLATLSDAIDKHRITISSQGVASRLLWVDLFVANQLR